MDTRAVMIAATALVLLTSCERLVVDARGVAAPNPGGAGATAAECTAVDVALSTIPSQATGEPVLKIPQPDGWERVTMMDSELIRYAMRNVDLVSDGFAPTAVVTLESQPGRSEPDEVFEAQRSGLERIFTALIAEGQAAGQFRTDMGAPALAVYLEFLYLAALLRWLTGQAPALQAEFDTMLMLFLGGLEVRA